MADDSILLSVEHLVRHYGPVKAVDDISFELRRGQSVGLIGANGAGKTTTMRMLMTMDAPDRGGIVYNGRDLLAEPEKVRGELGWMPDGFDPPAHTTVKDFLDFYARAYGLTGQKRVSEVQRVMEFCGVAPLSGRMVNALSKGQTQRVLLARTLVGDPQLLVMDEPAAGLDPQARAELKQLVNVLRGQGKTLLISSHILSELAEMCDTMIFMDKGHILYQGTQEELSRLEQSGQPVQLHVLGSAEALAEALRTSPLWAEVQLLSDGHVEGVFRETGTEAELAQELRRLSAAFELTDFHRRERRLEETFIRMLKQHE